MSWGLQMKQIMQQYKEKNNNEIKKIEAQKILDTLKEHQASYIKQFNTERPAGIGFVSPPERKG
jgi:tRNA 2-selenouridine synthase SelU